MNVCFCLGFSARACTQDKKELCRDLVVAESPQFCAFRFQDVVGRSKELACFSVTSITVVGSHFRPLPYIMAQRWRLPIQGPFQHMQELHGGMT